MNGSEPFIRAIIASPDDDLPRLIFADWLDEQGDAEWAALIRCQIAGRAYPTARGAAALARRVLGPALSGLIAKDRTTLIVSGLKGPRWMVRTGRSNVYYRLPGSGEPDYGNPMPRSRAYIRRGLVDVLHVPDELMLRDFMRVSPLAEWFDAAGQTTVREIVVKDLWNNSTVFVRTRGFWVPQ